MTVNVKLWWPSVEVVSGPLVEDPRAGRDVDRRRRRLAPAVQVDLVVGPTPASSSAVLSVGSRWIVTATPLVVFQPAAIWVSGPNASPSGRVEPPVGRKRETDRDIPIRPSSTPSQAPASGADAAVWVSTNDADDRDRDEDRPAAQVDRRDGRRIADPAPHPLRLLVEDVRADQQEQRGDAEQDQVRQLVRRRSAPCSRPGRRRRRSRRSAAGDARTPRTTRTSRSPTRAAPGRGCSAGTATSTQAEDGEVDAGLDHRRRGRLVEVVDRRAVRGSRPARPAAARAAPRRPRRSGYVSQRPQPTLGPMNPTRTPPTAASTSRSRYSGRPRTQRASSIAQAIVRQMRRTRPSVSQPSAGASGMPPVHRARTSPSGRPGVMT